MDHTRRLWLVSLRIAVRDELAIVNGRTGLQARIYRAKLARMNRDLTRRLRQGVLTCVRG